MSEGTAPSKRGRTTFAFSDRREAGRVLAQHLQRYANRPDLVVLGLPRGGVPVAFEVARALQAPLDVFVVRKLGVPGHEELAMGAIASGGICFLNLRCIDAFGLTQADVEASVQREQRELERRERTYRGDRPRPELGGRSLILVDDGMATGASMRAAIAALREQDPDGIAIAVPIAARETCRELESEADDVICTVTPEPFIGVGLWYDDFSETSDSEVRELLARARNPS